MQATGCMAPSKVIALLVCCFSVCLGSIASLGAPTSQPTSQRQRTRRAPPSRATSKPPSLMQKVQTDRHRQAKTMFRKHGCWLCHSLDGTDGLGPTLAGLYKTVATLHNGKKVLRDRAYFRAKIRNSASLELVGNRNNMPLYQNTFTTSQLNLLVEWLVTLPLPRNDKTHPKPASRPARKK
ncbi:MAG: c-type cytochrome [Deltaproteobacteria bacterium]|nr:MAG: c-type cytochrome [Deltaproteobacteria bacterium]